MTNFKALIVDDQVDILAFLEYELKYRKLQSTGVIDATKAIEKIKEEKFDLVIVDIFNKSGSNGGLIEFIHGPENVLNKGIPIIIMSGMIDEDFIARNKEKVYKIILKPFSRGEIFEAIMPLLPKE